MCVQRRPAENDNERQPCTKRRFLPKLTKILDHIRTDQYDMHVATIIIMCTAGVQQTKKNLYARNRALYTVAHSRGVWP